MIGHQNVGMDTHRLGLRELRPPAEEHAVIDLIEEDRGPVDTAQNRVHLEPGCDNTGVSGIAICCRYRVRIPSFPGIRGLSPVVFA